MPILHSPPDANDKPEKLKRQKATKPSTNKRGTLHANSTMGQGYSTPSTARSSEETPETSPETKSPPAHSISPASRASRARHTPHEAQEKQISMAFGSAQAPKPDTAKAATPEPALEPDKPIEAANQEIEDKAEAGIEREAEAKSPNGAVPISASPQGGVIVVDGVVFHHASEAEFARLLSYYGIEWQYEPHQFPLQWHDGRPVEMFSPDFYLTEYDLYIELTTMRQSLVRRKNRKLRLLRALYPEINIKLLYRRDYQRLLERFGIKPEELEAEQPLAISASDKADNGQGDSH